MKKVRFLQISALLVFAVLLVFVVVVPFYKGLIKGANGSNGSNAKPEIITSVISGAALDARSIDSIKDEKIRLDNNYQLENISIRADIRVNAKLLHIPWWLSVFEVVMAISMFLLLLRLAIIITIIIFHIYTYSIFNKGTVNLFREIGFLLIIYTAVDYLSQLGGFLKIKYLIGSPVIAINASSYDIVLFMCSLLVFIFAEALKQGAQLKEQQELTI